MKQPTLLVAGLLLALMTLPQLGQVPDARAHEGHAGSPTVFLATKLALKGMLPDGARIVRRKQHPSDSQMAWAASTHDATLGGHLVTYYLARDRDTEASLAAAMVKEVIYRHGKVTLGLGLDAEGRVTRAAVLRIHGKYVSDLKKSLTGGWLSHLKGQTVAELLARAGSVAEDDPAAQVVLGELANMGLALAALSQPVGK